MRKVLLLEPFQDLELSSFKLLKNPFDFTHLLRSKFFHTGHAFLGLQNFRFGTVVTSFCRLCGQVPERADHLLLRCPRLHSLRADCFRSWNLSLTPDWELDWVLRFLRDPRVADMENPENAPENVTGRVESEDDTNSETSLSDSY